MGSNGRDGRFREQFGGSGRSARIGAEGLQFMAARARVRGAMRAGLDDLQDAVTVRVGARHASSGDIL